MTDLHVNHTSQVRSIRQELAAIAGHERDAAAVLWYITAQPARGKFHRRIDDALLIVHRLKALVVLQRQFGGAFRLAATDGFQRRNRNFVHGGQLLHVLQRGRPAIGRHRRCSFHSFHDQPGIAATAHPVHHYGGWIVAKSALRRHRNMVRSQNVQQVHFMDVGIGMRRPNAVRFKQVFPLLSGIFHADPPYWAPAPLAFDAPHISAKISFGPQSDAFELVCAFRCAAVCWIV